MDTNSAETIGKGGVVFCRSNPIDPDPRVEKAAHALAKAGYKVMLLGWDREGISASREEQDGILVQRLRIPAGYGRGFGNLWNLICWQWGLFRWLFRNRKSYDIVHACDFDTLLPALWMKRLFGKKLVYDIFDFYADRLPQRPAFLVKLVRRMDLRAIRHADLVILASEGSAEQIRGARVRRRITITNSPEDVSEKIIGEVGSASAHSFHVVYVGIFQRERGLFELINVLKRHPEWRLGIGGFGEVEGEILERIRGANNIEFLGRISYEQTLQVSAQADVLAATYDPAIPNHRYNTPNKMIEAMMLSKPILVAAGTYVEQLVRQYNNGIAVPYGNEAALEEALAKLAADPQLRRVLRENGRKAYLQHFTWRAMEARLLDAYEGLVSA